MKAFLIAVLLSLSAAATPLGHPKIENRILELCNQVRARHGLSPLGISQNLRSAALAHSADMLAANYFDHANPADPSDTPAGRIRRAGVASLALAENIYKCQGYPLDELAESAVQAWMNSPDHRRNLLNPNYNWIGIGVCGFRGTYLFTQDFACVTIEILYYQVTPVAGGYQLQLRARVHSGPRQGALLFAGKRCGDWAARPDGEFEVTSLLPALGVVQIGQSVGPLNWDVETELELKG